jgi:dienelactone hydrolase
MSRSLTSVAGVVGFAAVLLAFTACTRTVTFTTAHPPGSVSAHLARPTGSGPFPAVILLHGGTGVEPNHRQWASWLAGEGYVALVVDSIRGAMAPTVATVVGDARGALNHLRTLPFVDGERIALMGFSRGAAAALSAVMRMRDTPPPAAGFRAAVLFYPPGCSPRIERAQVPVLLLIGQMDGGAETCSDLNRRLHGHGGPPVVTVIYPGAYHAFDDARATTLVMAQAAAGVIAVLYDAQATADARKRVGTFLGEHLRAQ